MRSQVDEKCPGNIAVSEDSMEFFSQIFRSIDQNKLGRKPSLVSDEISGLVDHVNKLENIEADLLKKISEVDYEIYQQFMLSKQLEKGKFRIYCH